MSRTGDYFKLDLDLRTNPNRWIVDKFIMERNKDWYEVSILILLGGGSFSDFYSWVAENTMHPEVVNDAEDFVKHNRKKIISVVSDVLQFVETEANSLY